MPYPPRVCFDGALYHVTTRGNNRQTVFSDEADYHRYLKLLGRYNARHGFTLHAFALMPNHVHLLIETAARATISRIMQSLGVAYTKYFNTRHKRVGHLFQGRFHSRLIDRDLYLAVATRYIHRNPVRAKLCAHPAGYPWSSYLAYVRPERDPWRLADPSLVMALVAPGVEHPAEQRDAYRAFVETPLPSDALSHL